jgi:hypothetical protein
MAGKPSTKTICGIEIPAEERTPLVEALLRLVEQLQEEVQRLKRIPEPPKRPPQSSPLDAPIPPSASGEKKKPNTPDGKRPGSAKRSKTKDLVIHEDVPLPLDDLPEGTKFLGYQDFIVQDLKIEPHNTRYRRCRYQLLNDTIIIAPLPKEVTSHFGPTLAQHVLYQHFHNHVTQPLLHEELLELGIDISAGQINHLLTEGHEAFHQEKDSLLPAAREVSDYLQTDDTSAQHQGQGGHTLHIGNDLFASFFTTESKSRVNFLKILLAPHQGYLFNSDAHFYLDYFDLPQKVLKRLQTDADAGRVYEDDQSWEAQLDVWEIVSAEQRRLLTEGALWAHLLRLDLYTDLVLISDDAGQFKLLTFFHGLCWVHMERHVARLIPLSKAHRAAYDAARDAIWSYYQRLKAYRESPTPQRRGSLDADFDRLFLQNTGWPELNNELRKIHGKKSELLMVLEHPEIPLHNNLSENDIRQYVKKRKISAGTRSDAGRRCRDTFLSLKTTCRKLGVTFWCYLRDRIRRLNDVPPLADLIRQKAAQPASI